MSSQTGDVASVATVYGAILLGTWFGCGLTGIAAVQCVLYYKLYPDDFVWAKALVFVVWALDMAHTICIMITAWESVITKFNQSYRMDEIPSALGLSIAITAAVTFMVHCFFANRIRILTKKWYIAGPVVLLAFLRLFAACVSTRELIRLKRYSLFINPYPAWVFTSGLALSASVEFIITSTMILLLGSRRTGFINMNHVINSLILYTLETGSFTCLVTIGSLICWIAMRHNLIFLGMHFTIAKLYANSLLATLNMRKRLRVDCRSGYEQSHQLSNLNSAKKSHLLPRNLNTTQRSVQLNVNVETVTVSQTDEHKDHGIIEVTPPDREALSSYAQDAHYAGMNQDSATRGDKKSFLV